MFWFMFFPFAYGSVPTAPIAEYELSGKATRYLEVFDNHAVSVDGDQASVVNIDSWMVESFAPCSVTAATVRGSSSDLPELWVGCDTGKLSVYIWDGQTWSGDGDSLIDVGDGAIRGFVDDGESTVFAIMEPSDEGVLEVFFIDAVSIEVSNSLGLIYPDYVDHTVGTNRFIIAHDGYKMSTFNLVGSLGNYTTTAFPLDAVDLAPDTVDGAYVLDGDGTIWQFEPDVSLGTQLVPVWTADDNIGAIGAYLAGSEAWFMTADGSSVSVYDIASGVIDTNEVLASFDYPKDVVQIQTYEHGYHFAGTEDGLLTVLSARPWVSDVSVTFAMDEEPEEEDTDTGMEGKKVTEPISTGVLSVSFASDVTGTYVVAVGGHWSEQGTTIDEGELASVGQQSMSIPVDTDDTFWTDGEYPIYVYLTADGFTGHGRDSIPLESAPGEVMLDSSNIGFDDGALILSFTELSDTDIDYYSVYISVNEFSSAEYPSGGPDFDGEDAVSTPYVVSATEASGQIVQRIEPLTNDVTYYVAVRAMDKSGLEGPMSNVVSERPRPSFNAVDLSGDPGGFSCSSVGTMALGWSGLFAGLLIVVRRKRSSIALLMSLGVGAVLALPQKAEAKEPRGDDTPQWGQFEARYGPVWLEDQRITEIYSGSFDADNAFNHVGQTLQFEAGPQFFRVVELDFGVGNYRKADLMQDETGSESTQKTVLNWIPLSVGVTGRLHFVDEQLLVPYVSYGRDWIVWSEKTEVSEGVMEGVSGVKYGWHWAAGLSIMLDIFDFSRASLLEATYGINDTYLTIEYREQTIDKGSQVSDGQDQLSFSGRMVTAGLKFDF